MERQVPQSLLSYYAEVAKRNKEENEQGMRKALADMEARRLVGLLYKKANSLLEEYGIEENIGKKRIIRETPPVKLVSGDRKLEFMIGEDYLHEFESFKRINIYQRTEGDDSFVTIPLFVIRLVGEHGESGELDTPSEIDIGIEAVKGVSDFVDVIHQSLSETHTPRSQQVVKPAEPKTGLTLFQKLALGMRRS